MALEQQTYEIAYELALEHIAEGRSLSEFCASYHTPLNPSRFRTWILRDNRRRKAFDAAKMIGTEAIEESLVRIADGLNPDGTPSINDVQRSNLMVTTRKWILQVTNREKYGDVKRVDSTVTTNTNFEAMSSDDIKRFVMRQAGIDAEDMDLAGG